MKAEKGEINSLEEEIRIGGRQRINL